MSANHDDIAQAGLKPCAHCGGPTYRTNVAIRCGGCSERPTLCICPEVPPAPASLDEALYNCGLAAHFGGEAMDAKRRGGREKLAYIERTAAAALGAEPGPAPLDVERLARALRAEGSSGRWGAETSHELRFMSETFAGLIAGTYARLADNPDTE